MTFSSLQRTATVLVALTATGGGFLGCNRDDGIREMTVNELSSQLSSTQPPAVFDANSDRVRHEYGVIPGATMLTSAGDYDLNLLPEQKGSPVVFYCSNTWCSAARTAAQRARNAGHTDVCVLPEGIKGWASAGKSTEKPTSGNS